MEAWVRIESTTKNKNNTILEQFVPSRGNNWIDVFSVTADGRLSYTNRSSQLPNYVPLSVASSQVLEPFKWYHVAVTAGTENGQYGARLYINGVQDGYQAGNWTLANPWNDTPQT